MKTKNKMRFLNVGLLLEEIQRGIKDHGEDFLNWEIALEQHSDYKECSNCNKPEDSVIVKDYYCPGDSVVFIKSHGIGCGENAVKKTLLIPIHY